ncbi:hypothetical protein HELRODRAFT_189408 [Helobdella robusta]|uniref:ETS domain-containing protein n=1 Tax=Helobdella robusta TaxID=6412 RepID=T1FR12_HELRO|nr:hypothetical protein HELRODRAFT_189408 [Helobdella robusta]ESN94474.1 hypothetical protein HELRODRAFT_189408 [Helobdella robusta]
MVLIADANLNNNFNKVEKNLMMMTALPFQPAPETSRDFDRASKDSVVQVGDSADVNCFEERDAESNLMDPASIDLCNYDLKFLDFDILNDFSSDVMDEAEMTIADLTTANDDNYPAENFDYSDFHPLPACGSSPFDETFSYDFSSQHNLAEPQPCHLQQQQQLHQQAHLQQQHFLKKYCDANAASYCSQYEMDESWHDWDIFNLPSSTSSIASSMTSSNTSSNTYINEVQHQQHSSSLSPSTTTTTANVLQRMRASPRQSPIYHLSNLLASTDVLCKTLAISKSACELAKKHLLANPHIWSCSDVKTWCTWMFNKSSSSSSPTSSSTSSPSSSFTNEKQCRIKSRKQRNIVSKDEADIKPEVTNDSYDVTNIDGATLCGMGCMEMKEVFGEEGEAIFVELELWKNAHYLSQDEQFCISPANKSLDFYNFNVVNSENVCVGENLYLPDLYDAKTSTTCSTGAIPTRETGNLNTKNEGRNSEETFYNEPLNMKLPPELKQQQHLSNNNDPILPQFSFFVNNNNSSSNLNSYNFLNGNYYGLPANFNNYVTSFVDIPRRPMSSLSSSPASSSHSDGYEALYGSQVDPAELNYKDRSGQPSRHGNQLWQFLKELLHQPHCYDNCIRWIDKQKGMQSAIKNIKQIDVHKCCVVGAIVECCIVCLVLAHMFAVP